MAADAVQQLLLSFGIDLSPMQSAAASIKQTLNSLNDAASALEKQSQSAARDAGGAFAGVKASAESAALSAKEAAIAQTASTAAVMAAMEELRKAVDARQKEVDATKQGTAAQKEKTEATEKEHGGILSNITARLRELGILKQQTEEVAKKHAKEKEGGEGGIGSAVRVAVGDVVTGALGGAGSLFGGVAGGVIAGEGISSVIEGAGRALEGFIDKLKEVSVESGSIITLEKVFDELSRGAGKDAVVLMQQLSSATEGLVSKIDLLKLANASLAGPVKFSSDQLLQMSHDAVTLGEASGNTAANSIQSLTRAIETGRSQYLGAALGITGMRDAMRNIPPVLQGAAREMYTFNKALALMHTRAEKIGSLPDTLEKAVTQLKVSGQNLMLAFGEGFNTSGGLRQIDEAIKYIIDHMTELQDFAQKVGSAVGGVFGLLADVFLILARNAKTFADIASFIVGAVVPGFTGLTKDITASTTAIYNSTGVWVSWGDIVVGTVKTAIHLVGDLGRMAFDLASGDWLSAAGDAALAKSESMTENIKQAMIDRYMHAGGEKRKRAMQPDLGNSDPSVGQQNQLAQARMAAQIAAHKAALEEKKDYIEQDKALDAENYADGEESFEAHQNNLRDLAARTRDASQESAQQDRDAHIADIEQRVKIGETLRAVANEQEAAANSQFHSAMLAAEIAYNTQIAQLKEQSIKQSRQTAVAAAKQELALATERIRAEQAQTTGDVRDGSISPDQYLQQRMSQIQALGEAQITEANRVYANSVKNQETLQARAAAIEKTIQSATDQLNALISGQSQIEFSAIQKRFNPQQSGLRSQLSAQQQQAGLGASAPVSETLQSLIGNGASQLTQYETLLEKMNANGEQFSDTWWNVYSAMQKVYQQQLSYNEQLQKAQDYSGTLAGVFTSLNSIAEVWTSKWAQNFSKSLGGGIKELQDSNKQRQQIETALSRGGQSQFAEDPHMAALQRSADSASATLSTTNSAYGQTASVLTGSLIPAFQAAAGKFNAFINPTTPDRTLGINDDNNVYVNASDPNAGLEPQQPDLSNVNISDPAGDAAKLKAKIDSFATGIEGAVGALTGFASAVSRSTSALAGAAAGGTAGYGAGNAAGGLLKNATGVLGALGPFAGVIGAGIGTVVGAFVGQKNAQTQEEVSQLSSQYSGIMNSFSQNTDNLNLTVTRLEALIQQASEDEANSKKGGSQFASLISQYNQELDSLTNQQSSIMSQMETQLAIFQTPSGMQSFLSTLNQIIEQYDKFAGAASNASQLAQANEFLADSLSQFTQSLQNNYTNDQESAINDALSLNELLSTRSTLMSNLNNQIVGVLEQGVLTRQQTSGQTKGQQIENIESAASQQLSSINQQISLEQYKVSIEQYIFNLATTKIGLETQLLALQEAQSSQSLAAIQALQQLLAALENGNYNFTTLQQLLNQLGYSGAAGLLPPSTLQPVGGATALTSSVSAAYQTRAAQGAGTYRGQNL